MTSFFKKNKELLYFGLFLILAVLYFSTQFLNLNHTVVHTYIDGKIPFLPIFIIPYILWYIYIPMLMLYMYFKDRVKFRRQIISLFSGAFLCILIFILFPTEIDFRPDVSGGGILNALCRIVYANDNPVNVFPSIHCYEATIIHLTTFSEGFGQRHKMLRICSAVMAVLICLSTLFVKQHSILDLISGCILAFIINLIVKHCMTK